MKKTLHMIGNGHLDPVWLWDWREGFQENIATFKSALDRLNEFDDIVFTSSSAQFYAWVEEINPNMFKEIKKRITEGRWVICGGWWVQPDCNIPSGESFARHSLISQNYFFDKFGVISKTGYCVDSFGHNAMLPQILKKSRMDNYVFMRPAPHEKELPANIFKWKSPDGSSVNTFRIQDSYCCSSKNVEEHIDKSVQEIEKNIDDFMCFYGVGNHGGGPTIETINIIKKIKNKYNDINIIFSDPNSFFEAIKNKTDDLPIVEDDLQHHAVGCYTAHSETKMLNRKSENDLIMSEKFASLASFLELYKYPDNFNTAWKKVLFNQFHDISAGSSIESAYFDMRNELGEAMSIASNIQTYALNSISSNINIDYDPKKIPFVIFNPHGWDINAKIEFESGAFENINLPNYFTLETSDGKKLNYQEIETETKAVDRKRITFTVDVQALGYNLVYLVEDNKKEIEHIDNTDKFILENDFLKVIFDENTGNIKNIIDKSTNQEYLSSSTSASIIEDLSDTWGHDVQKFDGKMVAFELKNISKIESGYIRDSIRVVSKYNLSTLIQIYTLYNNSKDLIVKVDLDFREKHKCLKFHFPINLENYKATYEIPFGHIVREANGFEESMQNWVDLSSDEYGVSILNDGKYGCDINKNIIGITILRTPVYAHHDPYKLSDNECYKYMDQGIHRFTYSILPHKNTWREANTIKKALELNQKPVLIRETYHNSKMPQKNSFIKINQDNVILSALKKSEKNDCFIMRVYETHGICSNTSIDIFNIKFDFKIKPYEIKTFALYPDGTIKEVDLLEWNL